MSKKFTDRQIKNIIADYIECGNYTNVAKKYKTSRATITRIIKSDPDMSEKVREKKSQNAQTVLEHMENKTDDVCNLVDAFLNALNDKERLSRSNVQQIAIALGIVIDKFTNLPSNNNNGKIEELIKGLTNGK